jgi:hypothetical protein
VVTCLDTCWKDLNIANHDAYRLADNPERRLPSRVDQHNTVGDPQGEDTVPVHVLDHPSQDECNVSARDEPSGLRLGDDVFPINLVSNLQLDINLSTGRLSAPSPGRRTIEPGTGDHNERAPVMRLGDQRDVHYQLPFGEGTRTIRLST